MNNETIEVGDQVVCLVWVGPTAAHEIRGTVLYTPCATGDAWHIRTAENDLVYVQTYLTITKLPASAPEA